MKNDLTKVYTPAFDPPRTTASRAQAVTTPLKHCLKCGEDKPRTEFDRTEDGRLNRRCRVCYSALTEARKDSKPRAYYYSPEYKRLQRRRYAERQGREFHPGRGTAGALALKKFNGQFRLVTPNDFAESTWERLERSNALQAWNYWVKTKAPIWWRIEAWHTKLQMRRAHAKYRRHLRRRRVREQSDGTVTGAVLHKMIAQKKRCMWCRRKLFKGPRRGYHPLMPTIEHIKPLADGGLHSLRNLGVSCAECNYGRAKPSGSYPKRTPCGWRKCPALLAGGPHRGL